jgi:hypothetical protein
MYVAMVVVLTALIGTTAFRFLPLFAALPHLVTYVPVLLQTPLVGSSQLIVVWPTLGALVWVNLAPGAHLQGTVGAVCHGVCIRGQCR